MLFKFYFEYTDEEYKLKKVDLKDKDTKKENEKKIHEIEYLLLKYFDIKEKNKEKEIENFESFLNEFNYIIKYNDEIIPINLKKISRGNRLQIKI